jgi:hypothetical protein
MSPSIKSFKVSSPNRKIQDVPNATPVISEVSDGGPQGLAAFDEVKVSVSYSSATGGIPDGYRVVSDPGNIVAVGGSPVGVRGLTPGTNYTFTATPQTSAGALGAASVASSSQTPTGTLVPIATFTGNGSIRDAVFSNIPQNYKDLFFSVYARSTASVTAENFIFYVSQSPIPNQSVTVLSGNGSSASATRQTNTSFPVAGLITGASATANVYGAINMHIMNYSSTTTSKPFILKGGYNSSGSGRMDLSAGCINTSLPITGIIFFPASAGASFATGTVITLYGVKGA